MNGTAAEEPSDHRTRFNRKKIPNINLESKKKVITFDKGDSYGNNIENDNYTDCDEDQNKDNDKDDNKDHWNDNDDDDKMMTMIIHSFWMHFYCNQKFTQ